jgi:hypothetical protein
MVVMAAGCGGPVMLQPKGKVLKSGAPLALKDGEDVIVFFVPVVGEGQKHPGDVYGTRYNEADGTFQVTGKDGKGLPPGKYKITVEHRRGRKDLFQGAFGEDKTPFVRDIDVKTGEIVLDLDNPTAK